MWQSHLMINKKNGIKAKFAANIIHYKVIKLIHDVKYVIAQWINFLNNFLMQSIV